MTVQESLGENRHHTGLTVGVLARTIHIRGGYVRAVETIKVAKGIEVDFAGDFCGSVGGIRVDRGVFGDGELLGFAVYGAAG